MSRVSADAKSRLEARLAALAAGPSAAIRLGLDGVRQVAQAMGLPMDTASDVRLGCPTVVVAGTNGKGSTCAMLASMAQQAGYRVAVYSSPHLLTFEERLTIDGEPVDAEHWLTAFDQVAAAQAAVQLDQGLTFFEVVTLAAIALVHQHSLDLAIFEIGLGGRLDAVNVLANDASVLTSVDLDHQAYLGDTREAIGFEKAHVARPGQPFVVADPMPPSTVLEVARDRGADVWWVGQDFNYQGDRQQWSWVGRGQRRNAMAYPALRGANQLLNASAALSVLSALRHRLPVSQQAVRQGLSMVSLPGRFQVLPGQPAVVLDVAHNPHAAAVLATNLDQMGFFPQTIAVLGLLSDKDAKGLLAKLIGRVDHWCLTDLHPVETAGRARPAESVAQVLRELQSELPDGGRAGMGPAPISLHTNPEEAIAHAGSLADPSDRIVVFGSFHTVANGWPAAHRLGQAPHAPSAH
ncbi:MAG: bifunctional folylpolyglutamate synthase/dihydrofolate synthase [Burkholderiaceae bacterium]